MFDIIILPQAKEDIIKAATWYNSTQKGLGKRFTKQIRTKIYILRKNSNSFSIRYDKTRTINVDIFPYLIHYKTDEIKKIVIINAIFHTSRNPNIWKERK